MALEQNQLKLGMADGGLDSAAVKSGIARPPLLLTIVFVAGMSVMAVQMCASRLISPYFGTSLLIWANLIGFTMIYLALGYFLGGRIADRFPRAITLYSLTGIAAVAMLLIPILSIPVLDISGNTFKDVGGGLFWGSVLAIILLFAIPLVLLGCVTPFAVRLRVAQIDAAGKTAGSISSLNTLGSIIGTFVPVLFMIPSLGTRATLYIFALLLLVFSLVGWLVAARKGQ